MNNKKTHHQFLKSDRSLEETFHAEDREWPIRTEVKWTLVIGEKPQEATIWLLESLKLKILTTPNVVGPMDQLELLYVCCWFEYKVI